MKRNQVNNIFNEDIRRKNNITIFVIMIAFIFAISILSFYMYLSRRRVEYVRYDENSTVKYNVHLKDNEFYKTKNIEENNQYISELIDYIDAEFNHNILLEKNNIDYKYSYRIEASATVNDKFNHKNIYRYDEVLVPKKELTANHSSARINEKVNIDYNKYNDLISKFVQTYSLYESENKLTVKLYVSVSGNCDENDKNSESITTIEIPLTQKTVAVDIKSNIISSEDNIMLCIRPSKVNYIYIVTSIIAFLLDIVLLVCLIRYVINTRSAKTVYDKELKKILNNYRSYIQKINNTFSFTGYQALKVDNFTDMLEIRDTTNQPILMVENGGRDSTYFVIPTTTKILYIYSIRVKDIAKEMNTKEN